MRIGELARKAGVSRDTIRFYEKQGLLAAETREDGNNYKRYPDSAVFTIEVIRDAQAAGMSIGDVAILLSQLDAIDDEDLDGIAFLDARIAETKARIAASARFLNVLHQTRAALIRAPYPDGEEPDP